MVIEIKFKSRGATYSSMDPQLLCDRLNDLRNRRKPRSHKAEKLISQLKDKCIEILNAELDRHIVVVWIWCHSEAALENIQKLYESNQLRDIFFGFANITPSTGVDHPKLIIVDDIQFKKAVSKFF